MQQFYTAINTGTVDPDKAIPELMEKLKSEGAYDKVSVSYTHLDVYKRQIKNSHFSARCRGSSRSV